MSDEAKDPKNSGTPDYEPPKGAETSATWSAGETPIDYVSRAGWTVLRKKEKPVAEIFSVSYLVRAGAEGDAGSQDEGGGPGGSGTGEGVDRPVTFVFNGGPGASSAYLHVGVVGPNRVEFPPDGSLPRMPPRLVPNEASWLAFTDLVFVDPVGTGFSRVVDESGRPAEPGDPGAGKKDDGDEEKAKEFFGYKRDLESLCEFMSRWLSAERRWGSPVFIAGESYGGYRVGRLVRMLQETTGVGLSGAILISPALELASLVPSDYDVLGWVELVPTMALAAVFHGRSRAFPADAPPEAVLPEAERFATGPYAAFLARGAAAAAEERREVLTRLADLIGLPVAFVERAEGRVGIDTYTRELLRDERRVLGLYDATITTSDPFPDRPSFAGADPTLTGIESSFTTAINRQLRQELGVETEREYTLLSEEVNEAWRNDDPEHFFVPPMGATDDFRYGMSLNPHMRAFISHGRYDLVCPYYASDRLRNLMRLDPQVAGRLTVRHFGGGHMFYAWEESRRDFSAAIARFVAEALPPGPGPGGSPVSPR